MRYKKLVEAYENITSTTKRLEKTYFVSELLKETAKQDIEAVILLMQGKIYPEWDERKIGISSKMVVKALVRITGLSESAVEDQWKKLGDLGDVTFKLLKKGKQSSLFSKDLFVSDVFSSIRKLSEQQGKGSVDQKLAIISDMMINASALEAKYIARTLVDNLRVGIGKGSLRDAVVWAFSGFTVKYDGEKNDIMLDEEHRALYNELIEKVQHAYDLTNDLSVVAKTLKEEGMKGLEKLGIEVGKPINFMLYKKAEDINDAFEIVGKPAAFEYKYDGVRLQVHKDRDKIKIFSRRFEDLTEQFFEVKDFVLENVKSDSCILDCEAVGYDPKTKRYLAFQKISQRIKRKYDIKEIAEKYPVELNVFDILYNEGKSLIAAGFDERRKVLESIVKEKPFSIVLASQIVTDDPEKAQKFYEKALKTGEEGLMAKSLAGIYKPGSRVGYGVKLKSIMEPLDLVIVAAEYGEGKRSGFLTSFYLACLDNGSFKEIGKVSTGLKELESEGVTFSKITTLLKPHIRKESGKHVELEPKIVIEVGYEEIQKSVNYSSGYALRFPRFIRVRTDEKTENDINTIEDVEYLYKNQRGRK